MKVATDPRVGGARPAAARGSRRARRSALGAFGRAASEVFLALLAVATVLPVVFVLSSAFRTQEDYEQSTLGLPIPFSLENLSEVWDDGTMGRYVLNSTFYVAASIILILLVAVPAGFALGHLRLRFRGGILAAIALLLIMPAPVLMIPVYRVAQELELLNHRFGLVIVYGGLLLPFAIYLMASYFSSIPGELLEAAHVDGANRLRSFWSVAVPLVRPGMLTLATLLFLLLWNELLFALLIVNDPELRTVSVGIAGIQGQAATPVPLLSSALLFSMVPPLIIFLIFQRRLADGLTAGAVR